MHVLPLAGHVLTGLLLTVLAVAPVCAAGLGGLVRDASGGAIAGVEVVVMTPQRAVIATARTGADGRFQIAALPEGRYLVAARAEGFREVMIAADVGADAETPLTITLDIDQIHQEVSVTATPGTVVDRQFASQPVNIITEDQIAQRATTVLAQAVNEEVGVNLQRTSPTMAGIFVRGLTGNKVNVFLDGVRYSTGAQRGGVNTFFDLVEPSSLETIEILRGPNSAEYGSDALGGSIQLLSHVPGLSDSGVRWKGAAGVTASSGHESGGTSFSGSMSRPSLGLYGNAAAQGVGELAPGGGIDSHASVTRFFGLPSDTLYPDRLPETGFRQWGTLLKANWTPRSDTQLVASYVSSRQDGGNRYDQLLGGDGNLVAELNDLTLDLFYVRAERVKIGWFDHASVTYSLNSQREERVNQGGNGNPRAAIGHEPERTTANGFQGSATRQLSPRLNFQIGGDVYFEKLTSDAFDVNPVTGSISPRRPRVPSGATFRNGGMFAQTGVDAVPDLVKIVGAVRWGGVRYRASATDAPIVNGRPLWPDDRLSSSAVTFRAGAVVTPRPEWTIASSLTRGYRAPHMTDLGTLGLTGAGFEVAAPDVAGLNGTVGNSAAATAVSTGDPVEQLVDESSFAWDASLRYRKSGVSGEAAVFVNNIHDNIQKQALILPQGAVGQLLGTEPITSQTANGTVFVALSSSPVLVRANFDNARIWGVELRGQVPILTGLIADGNFTYIRSRDTQTNRPPNIEGGTPAPNAWLSVRYTPPGSRWWVQPYLRIAADQPNLSSLDLGDRRTGADRSRTSIRNFFINGATARGWVGAGNDGVLGTADDVLTVTGETVTEIQNRVLGTANNAPLFSEVEGYVLFGVRTGFRMGRHEVLVHLENLTDENYRDISWGMDAPGRSVSARYRITF
jgi:outer membrane receptor for ferrienterochelin and colicin